MAGDGAREEVARVMRCSNPFELLKLNVRAVEAADVRRQYHTLALRLHPDKNPDADAKAAFVKLSAAYEELLDPVRQRELLIRVARAHKKATVGRKGEQDQSDTPRESGSSSDAAPRRRSGTKSFSEILKEWEDFERQYTEELVHGEALRQRRQERKKSMKADREEQEQGERTALETVLGEEVEERSASWSSFLKGKGKKKRKQET